VIQNEDYRAREHHGRGRRKTDTFSGATSTYAWDAESRLLSVARPGVTTNAFGYNGLDARVSKTDSTGTYGFKRNGAGVTDPVLSDGAAMYTPGVSGDVPVSGPSSTAASKTRMPARRTARW
jgi:YD repeat-containing protein